MKGIGFTLLILLTLAVPVNAVEFTAPNAPEAAQELMPDESKSFGEDLHYIIISALNRIRPSAVEAAGTCGSLIAVSLLIGLLSEISESAKSVVSLLGGIAVVVILLQPVRALIRLGTETVQQISHYEKLFLPVMTAAQAAQGAASKSSAIYLGTAFFDALLSSVIAELLVPLVYIYLCVSFVGNLFRQPLLAQIQKFLKWLMTWGLKIILYVFTGYISITGVVSGTADAAMLKATKLTISGMVPVVGSILADASEAVVVSAGLVKNAAGIYGLLVVIALWIGPFLQIGVQYMMLKVTSGITEMFGAKQMAGIVKDFSAAMGLVLAMTGTVCLIFLISTICFMKGAA